MLCLCGVAVLAAWIALRRFQLPASTGAYLTGTSIVQWTDPSRHEEHSPDASARRQIVAQIWYPAANSSNPLAAYKRWRETTRSTFYEALLQTHSRLNAPFAAAKTPFPVLIFGHAWNGQRTQDTALAEDLASHGYVVVSVDHPYNSRRVQMEDGTVIKGSEILDEQNDPATMIAYWNRTLETWAADDRLALDQMAAANVNPGDPMYGRLDTEHAGAFGHSFGGAVALRLCGLDPRIKTAANLDGWTFGALRDRTAAQPVMMLYEADVLALRDRIARKTLRANEDPRDLTDMAEVERNMAVHGGYQLFIDGTQHLDFSDQPVLPPLRRSGYTGPIAPQRIQTILRTTLLAFFDQTLRGDDPQRLAATLKTFPEVSMKAGGSIDSTKPQ